MSDDRDRVLTGPHEKLLHEIRQRREYAENEWREIREAAQEDMRFVSGDAWTERERREREQAGRPCLTLDELGQHFNQVINGVRANKRAIKFSPTGKGASEASAEWYQDKTREIEYRSHAQLAYTTAFQDAVHRGYGFARLTTKFVSEFSFNRDQELWIESFPNPDMVLPDPDAKRPDSSDMRYCFVYEQRTHDEFVREFPKARVVNFADFLNAPGYQYWTTDRKVTIAEYWTVEKKERTLLQMAPPGGGAPIELFEDELEKMPPGAKKVAEKVVKYPTVTQYLTNGVEILRTTPWPGKYIPIVSCYGLVIYVQGRRQIMSMTRLARDPYKLYCYYRTCEAELVGMTPKFPYFVREGSLNPANLYNLQKSLHEPVAVIEVSEVSRSGLPTPPEFPQRQPYEPPIQALEIGAESARRGIQSAMGSAPLPTAAQRRNEKSGVALQTIEDSSARGSYHFNDHYDDLIRQMGVMIEDLMDKIYDAPRDVGVMLPNETASMTRINDPNDADSISTKGEHLPTVSTGPSFDSEREADKNLAETLMNSPFAPQIADLVIKLGGGGPIRDEIAERLTPPQFAKRPDGEQPTPGEMQAQAAMQQMQGQLQELGQKVALDTVKTQSAEKIAAAEIKAKNDLEIQKMQMQFQQAIELQRMKDATTLQAAYITANKQQEAAAQQAEYEALALDREQRHEAYMAERDRQHDAQMGQMVAGQQQIADSQKQQAEHSKAEASKPPPQITVHLPKPVAMTRRVIRDAQGRATHLIEEPHGASE